MENVGRAYVIVITGAVTAAVDICEIVSAADAITLVEGFRVFQSTDTDSEALAVEGYRGHTTSGSGGSTNTPTPVDPGDSAFAGTVEQLNTTVATGGTPATTNQLGWNVLADLVWPTRPMSIVINPSQRWVLRLPNAPADSLTLRVEVYIREIGS